MSIFGKMKAWFQGEDTSVEREPDKREIDPGAQLDRDADLKADLRLGGNEFDADQEAPRP